MLKLDIFNQHGILEYRFPQGNDQYALSIVQRFQMIISHVLQGNQIDTISPHDIQSIISWNPKDPFEQETKGCVHELFATKAREIPRAEAVCGWDGTLTYEELDRLSSIAAAQLVRKGVKPGTNVPFAYDKSVWAVVATMAIVKAGAALVPLDPRDPRARLEEIIRGLEANVVVTMQSFVETFEKLVTHVTVFSAETLIGYGCNRIQGSDLLNHQKVLTPITGVSLSDPIFILFTSGSTGRPKGMVHTHRSMYVFSDPLLPLSLLLTRKTCLGTPILQKNPNSTLTRDWKY